MTAPLRLMTAEEAADRYGLPSAGTLRSMRRRGLPASRIGKAYLYEAEDVENFIRASKVTTCPAPTPAPASNGSPSGKASTSTGMRAERNASAVLARQTARSLKMLSRNSSESAGTSTGQTGHVIPIKS